MKLTIMQPYVFPYIGYFQLMRASDRLVLLDDVTFIKQGWINRNRVLSAQGPVRFTIPVEGASSNRRLCDLRLVANTRWRDKLCRTLEQSYRHASEFDHVWPVIETILKFPETRLTDWLRHSLEQLIAAIGLETSLISAAEQHPVGAERGVERVIQICQREGATTYINAEGGRALYLPGPFVAQGVTLFFLEHIAKPYPQLFGGPFVERLSIIDALMNVPKNEMGALLDAYRLVPAACRVDAGPESPLEF